MADSTVAKTILEQLGSGRFVAMTGAKNFVAHPDALSFRLPAGLAKKGINYIKITLNPKDLYDIEFGKLRGLNHAAISESKDVYAEDLRSEISETTGLALSL